MDAERRAEGGGIAEPRSRRGDCGEPKPGGSGSWRLPRTRSRKRRASGRRWWRRRTRRSRGSGRRRRRDRRSCTRESRRPRGEPRRTRDFLQPRRVHPRVRDGCRRAERTGTASGTSCGRRGKTEAALRGEDPPRRATSTSGDATLRGRRGWRRVDGAGGSGTKPPARPPRPDGVERRINAVDVAEQTEGKQRRGDRAGRAGAAARGGEGAAEGGGCGEGQADLRSRWLRAGTGQRGVHVVLVLAVLVMKFVSIS